MYHRIPIRPHHIVFLGDSLTEAFDLDNYFRRKDLINRGISGNTTDHVLYRLEELINAKPVKIMLLVGINDLYQGLEPQAIFENITRIIDRLVAGTPATRIYVQSVLPVNELHLASCFNVNVKIYELNNLLRVMCKNQDMTYIDLHSEFLNNNGELDVTLTYDGVHLTPKAYRLWYDLVKQYLD
jgi:lysophospholipase L1-like esterase